MIKSRNKSLIQQVMERDFGLCCCCGFKADEAHHIIPLAYGGEDKLDNMIAMCSLDHYCAPDTKEEFQEYVKHGGARLDMIIGNSINHYFQNKENMKDLNLQKVVEITKNLINITRKVDIDYYIKKYSKKSFSTE